MTSNSSPVFLFYQDTLLMMGDQLPAHLDVHTLPTQYKIETATLIAGELNAPHADTTAFQMTTLRTALSILNVEHQQLAIKAKNLLQWKKMHQFCGQCGHPTQQVTNQWAKQCGACKAIFYPRFSPSVIVLIHNGQQVLLGREPRFSKGVYSCIAGFIEPGETAEMTIHREVYEETNVLVKNIEYFRSQPWPFPDSFMLGYFAEYAGGEINTNDHELEDLQWFDCNNLPTLPLKASIAYDLITTYCQRLSK